MERDSSRSRRTVLKGFGTAGVGLVAGVSGVSGKPGKGKGKANGNEKGKSTDSGGTVVEPGESIQAAVDNADPGTTVRVKDGEYREQVIVRKDLTIQGEGDPTILPPAGELGVSGIAVVQPIIGAAGESTELTLEGLTVDGEDAEDKGGFYSAIGYFKADGKVRDVTVKRADFGGFITQNLGGGGEQDVTVEDSEFSDLGLQPLVFNERGTTGKITGNEFVGTPGSTQYALTAGYGASVDVKDNTFEDFYAEDGSGIGFYAFNSSDCTVQKNEFKNVQYAAYFLASSSSNFENEVGDARFIKNEITGTEVEGVSYGTTLYANDLVDDDVIESADNIKVVNNTYTDLDYGVATYAVGDGQVDNTKIIRNEFSNVGTPIVDNGEDTKQQANRVS